VVKKTEIAFLTFVSLLVLSLSTTILVAGEVKFDHSGALAFSIGPLIWLYIIAFIFVVVLITRNLLSVKSDERSRLQARIVLVAFLVSSLLGLLFNSIIPFIFDYWDATQFSPIATVILATIIVYAIARHGLFDIRLAAIRTLAYILSLATLSVVYYYSAYIISIVFFGGNTTQSVSFSPINISLALILAFLFQPVRRFFDKITDRIFYKDNYNTDDFSLG